MIVTPLFIYVLNCQNDLILIKNTMKVQIVLVAAIMLVSLGSASQVINMTCKTVATSTCASGYQYVTLGDYENVVLNSTYCVPVNSSCVVGTRSFNIQTCTVDYKNTACSTGVCYMYPQVQVCSKDRPCYNDTSSTYYTYSSNYTCGTCPSNITNCDKCFNTATNQPGVASSASTCLGSTCTGGLATANTNVATCNGGFDFFGEKCQCCVTTQEVSRFCTTNSAPLSQTGVTNWFMQVEGYLF